MFSSLMSVDSRARLQADVFVFIIVIAFVVSKIELTQDALMSPSNSTSIEGIEPVELKGVILEAWDQGLVIGSLLVMLAVTVANMRKRVLLHKLILTELILAMASGTFIFSSNDNFSGWYLFGVIGLYLSWSLHNVIAWLKNRPFLSRRVSIFYIGTVALVQPYWVMETYVSFAFYNNINDIFLKTRPLEPLFRDPWWIFTTCSLFYTIKKEYNFGLFELVRVAPRFGIMLLSMCLSIAFLIVDTLSVLHIFSVYLPEGIEPFWRLSFVFKCLCDTVILDDFKTALDRMRSYWLQRCVLTGTGTNSTFASIHLDPNDEKTTFCHGNAPFHQFPSYHHYNRPPSDLDLETGLRQQSCYQNQNEKPVCESYAIPTSIPKVVTADDILHSR